MKSYAQRYSEVVLPDRMIVLGRELRAPTIGHLLLVLRTAKGLGAAHGHGRMGDGELIRLLWILSQPWAQAARSLQDRPRVFAWTVQRLWRWQGWQLRAARRLGLMTAVDRLLAAQAVSDWIDLAFDGPTTWEAAPAEGAAHGHDAPEARTLCAPFLQVMKVRLMHCFGISAAEALEYPLREALWDLACWAEDHGKVEWLDAETEELIATLP